MAKGSIQRLMKQMNSVIIGKEEQVRLIVIALLARGHVLLEDVPGVGKTTLAVTLSKSLDLSFGRIQFTPDTLPSDITGVSIYNRKTEEFTYQKGAIMNHIVLADEINRTSPKTQASLLEAMEEKQVTVDGIIHKIKAPFMVIATQNPNNFLGTYNLPEAQLDRFLMRISLGYPSFEEEQKMAKKFMNQQERPIVIPVMDEEEIIEFQKKTDCVKVHEDIVSYTVSLIEKTRENENIILGASPRATIGVLNAAKAAALLHDRDYVIPDDIQEMFCPVVAHRLVLSSEARMNNKKPEDILNQIVIGVKVPVLEV